MGAHAVADLLFLDVSRPEFPGIILQQDGKFHGPRITDASHPHMRTGEAMVSVPRVRPGDMVFWHSDLVHSVEEEHSGKGDSSGTRSPPSFPPSLALTLIQ